MVEAGILAKINRMTIAAKSMADKDPTICAAASRWLEPEMSARRKLRNLQTNAVKKLGDEESNQPAIHGEITQVFRPPGG